MDFARLLGVEDDRLEWNLAVPAVAYEEARAISGDAPYLVINPCSNARLRNFRNWSVEGYASVIEHAWVQHGLKSVLTGGGSPLEREMGDHIEALCQSGSVINAIGGTSLKGVLALIDNARAVIAPDTGPAHMGNAMGTPTLGLYATTNPQRAAPYLWRDFAVKVVTADGAAAHEFVLPLNAPRGVWRVLAREAISGLSDEGTVEWPSDISLNGTLSR